MLKPGEICTFRKENGAWGFFWILAIDKEAAGDVFSLSKFEVQSESEILSTDSADVDELKGLARLGHFPITAERVAESQPKVIGFMPVTDSALEGYKIWREAYDKGEAGVFIIPLESI
jgi:hypothetical protein